MPWLIHCCMPAFTLGNIPLTLCVWNCADRCGTTGRENDSKTRLQV